MTAHGMQWEHARSYQREGGGGGGGRGEGCRGRQSQVTERQTDR